MALAIACGILAGLVGFVPLFFALLDRPSILPFGISEIAAFIAVTSVYFMWRNRVFRREKKLEDDSKGDLD